MTRKHYVALARAIALSRPTREDFTTTSAVGDNTFFSGISYEAALAAWAQTRDAVADALLGTNPQYDHGRFVTATEA